MVTNDKHVGSSGSGHKDLAIVAGLALKPVGFSLANLVHWPPPFCCRFYDLSFEYDNSPTFKETLVQEVADEWAPVAGLGSSEGPAGENAHRNDLLVAAVPSVVKMAAVFTKIAAKQGGSLAG